MSAIPAAVSRLKVKLFADGADLRAILALYANPLIRGFTTNPTLMRKAGVAAYEPFAKELLAAVPDRPVSLEVFADDFPGMERQAHHIAAWGDNVYVKIPITNTAGESACPLLRRLSGDGIRVNVTAMLTRGYIEVLFKTSDTPLTREFDAGIARYAGVHLLAFAVADARAQSKRLAKAGFKTAPLVALRRPVSTETGVGAKPARIIAWPAAAATGTQWAM